VPVLAYCTAAWGVVGGRRTAPKKIPGNNKKIARSPQKPASFPVALRFNTLRRGITKRLNLNFYQVESSREKKDKSALRFAPRGRVRRRGRPAARGRSPLCAGLCAWGRSAFWPPRVLPGKNLRTYYKNVNAPCCLHFGGIILFFGFFGFSSFRKAL